MLIAGHRIRYIAIGLVLSWMALMLLSRPAHGAWSADPVQVHATSALCPAVAAIDDGHSGAYIAWQENGASGGVIRAQHLLASGDVDPAWSGPVHVSDRVADRSVLGAVSAGVGGAYFWWMEGAQVFIQRITRIGTVAPGWSSGGRMVMQLPTADFRPSMAPDGNAGVYIGGLRAYWTTPNYGVAIMIFHLNASGGGAAGWPSSGRIFGAPLSTYPTVSSFGLDPAPDGGLWLAWQRLGSSPPLPGYPPGSGELRVIRLSEAGLPAPGWTADGDVLGPFLRTFPDATYPDPGEPAPAGSQVAVAHDDAGGAYIVSRQPSFNALTLEYSFQNVLRRVDAVGYSAPGWPLTGVTLSDGPEYIPEAPTAEAAVRAIADDRGGVLSGLPFYASEFTSGMGFSRRDAAGGPLPGGVDGAQNGIEFAPRGDGGMFIASFKPSGATGPYEADAYIAVSQSSPGAGFFESKVSYSATRYGDIGLTATGDGGAIFAWSQLIDRQGIYAIRLGQAGPVTGVPPTPVIGPPSLRVRFVRGDGVHAVASFSGSPRVALSLYDVSGRRVAGVSSDATLGADVVLPGTRDLAGGVYFARASDGRRMLDARVLVVR